MERRTFLRLTTGGVVVAAAAGTAGLSGCSSALPAEALAAWQPPPRPAGAAGAIDPLDPDTTVRRWLLSYALLAPHSHNLQSWLVDLQTPGQIVLYLDLQRLLPETDPFARQMMMSQGTFIELLAMAAAELGLYAQVQLFPQGTFGAQRPDARPTALITLLPADGSTAQQPDPLFAQIVRRHTHRAPYDMRTPDAAALASIRAAAQHAQPDLRSGFAVASPDPAAEAALNQHRQIAMDAWKVELETPHTLLESYRWIRLGPKEIATHRDGISINEPMVRALAAVGLFDRSKASAPDDPGVRAQISGFNEAIAATPAFFWMVTPDNGRSTQVHAGRAYVRAQLAATAAGLFMHPLQQALQEYPEQATHYQRIHQLLGATAPGHTVQMWARLGYAPPTTPSPRRGVDAHIMKLRS
jgi:hypothetical protein